MKRSQRMNVVLQMAEREEQDSVAWLSQCRETLQAAEDQLAQMIDYEKTFALEIKEMGAQGVHPQRYQRYQLFYSQLKEAQAAFQGNIRQCEAAVEMALKGWQALHARRLNIEDLIERLCKEENDLLEKKLQQEMDELAQLAYQRQQSNNC
ncbi:MAG: flagellar export protein FliJ [Cellvibrionaceae bacterium]